MEEQSLEKRKNVQSKIVKLSEQDLVLAKMLDLAAQVLRQEVMPMEVRFWSETFAGEKPEMIVWAFQEYLRKAKFFPKPGDISELIEKRRAEWSAKVNPYTPIDREATEREQSSPEWEELSKRARETLAKIAGKTVMR